MGQSIPRLFISYSHDSQAHKDWVLQLSTRLVANSVDVVLDQWDLRLGSNLQAFMESAATTSGRVLAVCTEGYVAKANEHRGGVGYEKIILTADLIKDLSGNRIIPLVRDAGSSPLPHFLLGRVYIDFRNEADYEARYAELIHELHGRSVSPRPSLGDNPFTTSLVDTSPLLAQQSARYVSPGLQGKVSFNYDNNNGCYVIGAGDMTFETYWSEAGPGSIHALNDPPSIRSVALVENQSVISSITDATLYDASSRARIAEVGDTVVWQNVAGYYAATSIQRVTTRHSLSGQHELVFTYSIQPSKSSDFSTIFSDSAANEPNEHK